MTVGDFLKNLGTGFAIRLRACLNGRSVVLVSNTETTGDDMATKAQDARFAALVKFNADHLPEDNKFTPRDMSTQETMLCQIMNIRAMGKTERWSNACIEWFHMVRKAEDVDTLRWAIIEGSNKANYANI